MQPLVMLLIEHDILNSHVYCDQAKCFDFGEKGSMAESWRKTKRELQPFFFFLKTYSSKLFLEGDSQLYCMACSKFLAGSLN